MGVNILQTGTQMLHLIRRKQLRPDNVALAIEKTKLLIGKSHIQPSFVDYIGQLKSRLLIVLCICSSIRTTQHAVVKRLSDTIDKLESSALCYGLQLGPLSGAAGCLKVKHAPVLCSAMPS